MTKSTRGPVHFALEEMYEILNSEADYTYSKLGTLPATLRAHLRFHPDVELIRQISVLDGDDTSLFRHTRSSALIFLRQYGCQGRHGCYLSHGELTITASKHEDLLRALFECDLDGTTLDEFLGTDGDAGDAGD
jgi:hypothetical protein